MIKNTYTDNQDNTITIVLDKGYNVIIDKDDKYVLYDKKWRILSDKDNRVVCANNGTTLYMNRYIASKIGLDIENKVIKHINDSNLDCRRSNLQAIPRYMKKTNKNNRSAVTGVSYDKTNNRWIASISNDVTYKKEYFKTKELAISWRQAQESILNK